MESKTMTPPAPPESTPAPAPTTAPAQSSVSATTPTAGLRKRQQINVANRIMLLWISGASAIVGIALVLTIFLVQKIAFNQRVIDAKTGTVSILSENRKAVPKLKEKISVLNTDENLASVRLNDSDPPVQSVLDALPASANVTAMGSSLQKKLLAGVPNVAIESINVEPAADAGNDSNNSGPLTMKFTFSVSVPSDGESSLQALLQKVEKSIRPFNVTSLTVDAQANRVTLMAEGVSYYQPAQKLDLLNKVIKQS